VLGRYEKDAARGAGAATTVLRILAVAAVFAALMVAIKDRRLLQRVHVVGSCASVANVPDGSEWRRCVGGHLTGPPGLASAGCTDWGTYQDAEFWHCPAELAPNALRQ
jgi:hypothetical protein